VSTSLQSPNIAVAINPHQQQSNSGSGGSLSSGGGPGGDNNPATANSKLKQDKADN